MTNAYHMICIEYTNQKSIIYICLNIGHRYGGPKLPFPILINIILYSQSGIEHVHVQYKTYKEKKNLKSSQIIDNFPYRLFRICIIIV